MPEFLGKLTSGDMLIAFSYLASVVLFLGGIKPRLAAIEGWQRNHDKECNERDKAITQMAINVSQIAAHFTDVDRRMNRMEERCDQRYDGPERRHP